MSTANKIRFPGAIILIFLLEVLLHVSESIDRKSDSFSPLSRMLVFTTGSKMEVWRFITYMFVHKDNYHLSLNIFWQLVGGVPFEMRHGWWRVSIIYLAGVLSGSLAVASISRGAALVGASGGVYSILGAHFSTLILNWNETDTRLIRMFILLVISVTEIFIWMCLPLVLRNHESGLSMCVLVSELTSTTVTHFAGCVIGSLTALIVIKVSKTCTWQRTAQRFSLTLLICMTLFTTCLIILFSIL